MENRMILKNSIVQKAQRAVAARADFVSRQLKNASGDPFWQDVADVFNAAYQNPILTTAEILSESPVKAYAGTGGWGPCGPPRSFPPIPSDYPDPLSEMWVRDACAQYHAYLGIIADHKGQPEDDQIAALGSVIEGIVRTCSIFLTGYEDNPDCPKALPLTSGSHSTPKVSNITIHAFLRCGKPACAGLDYEPDSLAYLIFLAWSYQAASGTSRHLDEYFWKAAKAAVEVLSGSDTEGGNLHKFADGSALTKTPFRPSDDGADHGVFNIPVNAFCAVAMEKLAELALKSGTNPEIAEDAAKLGLALRRGVQSKGVAEHLSYGRIFAYETDAGVGGNRSPCFMDDACGEYPSKHYIHESFNACDPNDYTRGWFAWANALFGEWVDTMVRERALPFP